MIIYCRDGQNCVLENWSVNGYDGFNVAVESSTMNQPLLASCLILDVSTWDGDWDVSMVTLRIMVCEPTPISKVSDWGGAYPPSNQHPPRVPGAASTCRRRPLRVTRKATEAAEAGLLVVSLVVDW